MKTFVLAIAAAAALNASALSSDAKAMTIGSNAGGLQQAIDDADLIEKVHCCHRRVYRVYYRRVIVVPRYYVVYRRRYCCY